MLYELNIQHSTLNIPNSEKYGVKLYSLIMTNCRRLWRPRHSLGKQAAQIIYNKNALTNCSGYGGDAIASYCLLCQLTH